MRKMIQQQTYTHKQDKYHRIFKASESDTKTFCKLVKYIS